MIPERFFPNRSVSNVYNSLNRPGLLGERVKGLFDLSDCEVSIVDVQGERLTQFVRITIPGSEGKIAGGTKPTFGIVGRLGALAAYPEQKGLVSDADGAIVAISTALMISNMRNEEILKGDVIVTTHLCTDDFIDLSRQPPFMGMPVSSETMNKYEVEEAMDFIISVDTSRGNMLCKAPIFAVTPIVVDKNILPVPGELLELMVKITNSEPAVFPITNYDLTEYDNGLPHVNSIMQPSRATTSPVMGVAITSKEIIAGSAINITNLQQIQTIATFLIEVARKFTSGQFEPYDKIQYEEYIAQSQKEKSVD